jgi:cell division protein FtsI/penicillin-binding protein 2
MPQERRPRGRRPAEASARSSERRAKIAFYLFAVLACAILGRFYVVQVREGPMLAKRAYDQRLTTVDYAAHRGAIYDRDGTALARSLPSQSVYVTTGDVKNAAATARALAAVLPGADENALLTLLQRKPAYVQIAHKVTRDQADEIAKLGLPGVGIVAEPTGVRFVPAGRLASTVIGFTGYKENGLAGIEFAYDSILRGAPGRMARETDEFGRSIPFERAHVLDAARPGYSLQLTLDSYLQYNVENVLRSTVAKWHAESGTAIVMDPQTGEILALANAPDFDVRTYGRFSPDAWRDRAVEDAYEPGSVFKLVTAAAALDSGKVGPADRFASRDRLPIGGYTIYNAEDGFLAGTSDSETLEDIITYSHNVGAAEVGLRIGKTTLFEALQRFGFGSTTHVGLPGESPGIVPDLADWSETTLPTIAFGQGISTTPLAIARAYCAIANGGLLLRPRIVAAIVAPDGTIAYRYGREIERRAITERTAAILRRYLRSVVLRGTGNPTAQVPGYTTAGKTGTAQIAENGFYASGEYVASFVGLVPADSPRYVILVKVSKPRGAIYGGVVAAPAFAQIAKIAMMHAGILPAATRLVRAGSVSKQRI